MKYLILALSAILLSVGPSQADSGVRIRYLDPSGPVSLTVNQDIDVGDRKSLANREFSFALTLSGDPATDTVSVTIDRAEGSYAAHELKRRLGTRHLPERTFGLAVTEDRRRLVQTGSTVAPLIHLGGLPATGYAVAGPLVDALPALPDESIEVGTRWTTARGIRSLEGWGWGVGRLTSRHRVTAIDHRRERTVVSVTTLATGSLGPIEGEEDFHADLKRTMHWTFDATRGRLLSMTIAQEAKGTCVVPQGQVGFVQHTRIELTTPS